MPKQPAFLSLRDAMKKKQTRRERFLAEMDAVVPWGRRLARIARPYLKMGPKGDCTPMPLEVMLRFAGMELGGGGISDETTILNFRHLLERHGLTQAIFADIDAHLAGKGIILRSGTLVEATFIDASSSTKNKAGARDPEMASTKKGNDWYFGMKVHIGIDADSGVTHSLQPSTAKLYGSQVWDDLLHGEATSGGADKGYVSTEREEAFQGPGKVWGVMRKAQKGGDLYPLDALVNRIIAMVLTRVEHPFRAVKRQFGHGKTLYRGARKEPCPALHAVCAPDATETGGMRTRLPEVPPSRHDGGSEAAKTVARNPSHPCQADQAATSAKPNDYVRRSTNMVVCLNHSR